MASKRGIGAPTMLLDKHSRSALQQVSSHSSPPIAQGSHVQATEWRVSHDEATSLDQMDVPKPGWRVTTPERSGTHPPDSDTIAILDLITPMNKELFMNTEQATIALKTFDLKMRHLQHSSKGIQGITLEHFWIPMCLIPGEY